MLMLGLYSHTKLRKTTYVRDVEGQYLLGLVTLLSSRIMRLTFGVIGTKDAGGTERTDRQ